MSSISKILLISKNLRLFLLTEQTYSIKSIKSTNSKSKVKEIAIILTTIII